jgi:hypothetical protein
MLHEFLHTNRLELTTRCRAKVAARPSPAPTPIESGVPVLIEQLVDMLRADEPEQPSATPTSAIGRSAAHHGRDLLQRGFTVDQVVHDYGDLCQAVTELAQEQHAPISVAEFHTFNRCLDSAIAEAVREFARQRDRVIAKKGAETSDERLESFAYELGNLVSAAALAYAAIKHGHGAIIGATGEVLDQSIDGIRALAERALADSLPLERRPDVSLPRS